MTDLLALADRVERLTGPNREVDGDIFFAVGGKEWDRAYARAQEPCGCGHATAVREAKLRFAPRYTASLDAAMTLVPDDCRVSLELQVPARTDRRGFRPVVTASCYPPDRHCCLIYGATSALALTAAALRARAASGDQSHE